MLENDRLEYHILTIPTELSIDEHIQQTTDHLVKGEFSDLGTTYFKEAGEILKEEIQMTEEHTYLFVKLTTPVQTADPVEAVELFKQMLGQTFKNIVGRDSNQEALLSLYMRQEKQLYENLLNYKNVRRLTEEDYRKITYYQFHRATPKQLKRKLLDQEIHEGIVTNERGYLTIEQLDHMHFSAFLPLVDVPTSLLGSGLIQNVKDSVNFPLDTSQRIVFRHPKKDADRLNKMRKRLLEQNKEVDQTQAIVDDDEVLLYGDERLNELNNEMKKKLRRLCRATIVFVVSATSKEVLDERIADLDFVLDGTDFNVYRPIVDHLTLFNQTLIGSKHTFNAYEQVLTTGYVADLGVNLTKKIGNRYGMPLGRVITGKQFNSVKQALSFSSNMVWFYPNLTKKAIEGAVHTNGNTLITGPPGMGKSVLVKYLFMWLTFLGQKVLYVDPKNETELFFKKALEKYGHIPHFRDMYQRIHFVSLSTDATSQGLLDPLLFLTGDEAIQTAKNVLEKLAEINKHPETYTKKKTTIQTAVMDVVNGSGKKNLSRVIDRIEQIDKEMATLLRGYTVGLAKILIGTDDSQAIQFTNQVTVLGIQGLKLPSKEEIASNELDNEQTASSVIMEVIMKFTYVFSTDKSEDACIIYDELKTLEHSPKGSYLLDDNLRKGRANNTDIYLVTQAFMDYDQEDQKELLSYKFAFKPKQEEAQRKVLQFFGMKDNEGNMGLIRSLVSGTCLFQDHLGRNQAIAIDVLFDSWLEAISSTDKASDDIQQALAMEQGTEGYA